MRSGLPVILILGLMLVAFPSLAQTLDTGVHRFLQQQTDRSTGIPASFIYTDDPALVDQAATYDLALAGMGHLLLNDLPAARRILSFLEGRWGRSGLCNFYHTRTGGCGIESTVHLGPNMWVAMLALQYTSLANDRRFYPFARKIALWALELGHRDGALAMGPQADWGADWPNVYGAESNIVAYGVFREIARQEKDPALKVSLELEMQGIRDFLKEQIIVKDQDGTIQNIHVGSSFPAGRTGVTACDMVSMLLLVFDPQELQTFFAVDPGQLMDFARQRFLVEEDGIRGFDFTDEPSARAIRRPRMISIEWTMQIACALGHVSQKYLLLGQDLVSSRYHQEADLYAWEVDRKAVRSQDMLFYAYATKDALQVFPFAPWWQTPQGEVSRSGAMASTMWRLFYAKGMNPLRVEGAAQH